MIEEAERMREADQKRMKAVQAKHDGETLSYQVDKQLSDFKDKMSKEEAEELKSKLADLREVMTKGDAELEDIEGKTKALQDLSWKVTASVYGQSSGGEEDKKDDKKE